LLCGSLGGSLNLPLVDGLHDGLPAVLLSGWQRIAYSFSRQRLSRRFARRISQRMATDCSFFLSSTAFTTVCAQYCSADGSGLLILPLVNGFHDSSRTVLLSGSLSGSLNLPLVNGFHESSRTVLLSGSLGGSLNLPLVDGLHDGLPAVLLSGWQ